MSKEVLNSQLFNMWMMPGKQDDVFEQIEEELRWSAQDEFETVDADRFQFALDQEMVNAG